MTIRILIADDEKAARFGLRRALERTGHVIEESCDGSSALVRIKSPDVDLVFLDLDMPGMDGREVLKALDSEPVRPEVVVVTADDRLEVAVECMRLGASDYVTKPYEVERLRAIVARVARQRELERRVADLEQRVEAREAFGALVGVSRAMRELFSRIERVATAPVDVLLRGETGTGKELVARELHRRSARAAGPFVAVNTAAIPEPLVESELFGHVKGAFTGANSDHRGCFEQADGGTIFLDEVGDMPGATQAKILRVLEERQVTPVGSSKSRAVDVRVVSATHQDLDAAREDGRFREDLYFRLKGVELVLPPLRERREDIGLLADVFLSRAGSGLEVAPAARDRLLGHQWPGNVRELEQVLSAASVLCDGGRIEAGDLDLGGPGEAAAGYARFLELPLTAAKAELVAEFERASIEAALARSGGNISAAARQLGIHRQSLQQKLKQLRIRSPD